MNSSTLNFRLRFAELNRSLTEATNTVLRFLSSYRREQERLYLLCNDRLPGSLRTKRLRKKRLTRVRDWNRRVARLSRGNG